MIRGLDEELATRKYSHVERERRFLVDPTRCPDLTLARAILIEDRYIIGTRFRLRKMTDLRSRRVVLKLSKKYDVADVRARPLVTSYLDDAEYGLLGSLPAKPLTKTRYTVDGGFGIDVFGGALAGLMLAEIESPDAVTLAAVAMPDWATREVTEEAAFQGGNLSTLNAALLAELLA